MEFQNLYFQDLLVPVFASEKWRGRPVTINFYGEGPDGPALKRMAEEAGVTSFRYRGRVSDIAKIWRDNHALLMPSRMEGLPIMLVSAMVSARVPAAVRPVQALQSAGRGEWGVAQPLESR